MKVNESRNEQNVKIIPAGIQMSTTQKGLHPNEPQ